MRLKDAVRLALGDLWRHKLRTSLTVLGVTIAAVILVISLSTGRGVSRAVEEHFRMGGKLRRIMVGANYGPDEDAIPPDVLAVPGEMSDARRERLRKAIINRWSGEEPPVWLNSAALAEIAALPHVEAAVPHVRLHAHILHAEHAEQSYCASAALREDGVAGRVVAGRLFSSDSADEVLVHEYLAYRWGYQDEQDLHRLLGSSLRLELGRSADILAIAFGLRGEDGTDASISEARKLEEALGRLPDLLGDLDLSAADREILEKALGRFADAQASPPPTQVSAEFTIVGVFRDAMDAESRDLLRYDLIHSNLEVMLPLETARRLHDRTPAIAEVGYDSAMIYVDHERHLKQTVEAVEAMEFPARSLLVFVEHIQHYTALVTGAMALLAGVALLVAALGITNTMVMSVLERTRQIGLLKAVGFRNRHVLLILLVESGLIGLAGGILGVLATWIGSYPGESIARAILTGELGREVEGTLFVFPWWLLGGVPAFTTLVTMLAGVYPARRAARLDPLVALRQE